MRSPLPYHLPLEEIVHCPGSVSPGCSGTHFAKLGEDVTEVVEKIPARSKVIRHIRLKLSCRSCERILQVPAPDLPIVKGRPGPRLVANVVVGKYLDGLPLYRQSAILAREGIEIERATLADWVGHVAWWLVPLAETIGAHVMAAPVIHTDDTPIAVLAPGNGKTKTGRYGPMCSTSGPGVGAGHRRPDTASARTARANGRGPGALGRQTIWPWAARPPPCGLLGTGQAQILRCARGDQVADCRGGAATDR